MIRPTVWSLTAMLLLALFPSTSTWGQDANAKAAMEKMAQQAKPGDVHQAMAKLAGKWKVVVSLGRAKYEGEAEFKMGLEGRFLVGQCEAELAGQKMQAMQILGFDRRHDEFTIQMMDTFGTYAVAARGKQSDSNTVKKFKMQGKDNDPYMKSLGIDKEFAVEVDCSQDDRLTFNILAIDNRTAERKEVPMMSYQFERIK